MLFFFNKKNPPAPSNVVSSIVTRTGLTVNFVSPTTAGVYDNGDVWCVTGSQIASFSTPASVISGADMHGCEWNPAKGSIGYGSNRTQGWDSRMKYQGDLAATSRYSAAKNVDPGKTGVPFTSASEGVLVKAVSFTGTIATTGGGQRGIGSCAIASYTPITFVNTPPTYSDSFRPGIRAQNRTPRPNWRRSVVQSNMGIFGNSLDLSNGTNFSNFVLTARQQRLSQLRALNQCFTPYWSTLDTTQARDSFNGYGRDFTRTSSKALLDLSSTISASEKLEIACAVCQQGIDYYEQIVDGAEWEDNGGWTHGRMWFVLIAGMLMNDQYMINCVLNPISAPITPGGLILNKVVWSEQRCYQFMSQNPRTDSGKPGGWGIYSGSGTLYGIHGRAYNIPPTDEFLGYPMWAINCWKDTVDNSSHITPNYGWINWGNQYQVVLGLSILNTSLDMSSLYAYFYTIDRYTRIVDAAFKGVFSGSDGTRFNVGGFNQMTAEANPPDKNVVDLYNTVSFTRSRYMGKPEQCQPPFVTASGTQINVVAYPFEFGNGYPITRRDIRYSQDNQVTWTVISDVPTNHSFYTALGNTKTYVQMRLANIAGNGPWSVNIPNVNPNASNGTTTNLQDFPASCVERAVATTGVAASASILTIDNAQLPVYDTDPHQSNVASVTVTGTTDVPSAILQYRIFNADTDADVVTWTDFPAGGSTNWSVTVTRPASWIPLRVQVRDKTATAVTASQTTSWYAGYIIGLMGQSLAIKPITTVVAATYTPPLNSLWMLLNNVNGTLANGPVPVTGSSTIGLRRMAQVFKTYSNAPAIIVDLMHSGTSRIGLANLDEVDRSWIDTAQNPVDYIRTRGSDLSILVEHWFTSDAATFQKFDRHFLPFYARQQLNGLQQNPDTSGIQPYDGTQVNVVTTRSYTPVHFLWDLNGTGQGLFNKDRTKWVATWGAAHTNDFVTARADGVVAANDIQKGEIRLAIKNCGESLAHYFPLSLRSKTGWGTKQGAFAGHLAMPDGTHVAVGTVDGEPLVAPYLAISMLRALEQLQAEEPKIIGFDWAPSGMYVDVRISLPHGGNLSTAYAQNQAGAYAGSFEATYWNGPTILPETTIPEMHNVQGFAITRSGSRTFKNFTAEIHNTGTGSGSARYGVVRITPTIPFVNGNTIDFCYGDGHNLLLGSNIVSCKPHLFWPIETRTHVSGTGYGWPVIRESGTAVLATASGISGVVTQPLSITEIPTDGFVFGSARTSNSSITIKGKGTTGNSIQVRAASAGFNSTWNTTTVDPAGDWSVTFNIAEANWGNWYVPEARIGTDDLTKVVGVNTFGCGHVIGILGQSQPEQAILPASTYAVGYTFPTQLAQNMTMLTQQLSGGAWNYRKVTNFTSGQVNIAMAALSNVLHLAKPNVKFMIVDMTQAGTSRINLAFDGETNPPDTIRLWSDLQNVVDFIRTGGSDIDVIIDNWMGDDASTAATFDVEWSPFYFGQRYSGQPFTVGTVNPDSTVNPSKTVDHILWDASVASNLYGRGLFTRDRTKLIFTEYAPLRVATSGSEYNNFPSDNLDRPARDKLRTFAQDSRLPTVAGLYGPGFHLSNFGGDVHAVRDGEIWGLPQFGIQFAAPLLTWAGLNVQEAVITGIEVGTNGAYADMLVNLPPNGVLTTIRALKGLPAPVTEPSHYQPVMGVEIRRAADTDSQRRVVYKLSETTKPANYRGTVTIVDSGTGIYPTRTAKIRVTPEVAFATNDKLEFLRGSATAITHVATDIAAQVWLNIPIVNIPSIYNASEIYPYYGVPVRPQPPVMVVPQVGALVPEAFVDANWSVSDKQTGTQGNLTITSLPADGGSVITNIEWRANNGTAQSLGATTPGTYTISGLTQDVIANIEIRAVNAVGPAPWSNTESFTPTAADTIAPIINSSTPGDNAVDVSVTGNITITFNENVVFGTGNIILRKNTSGTWSDVEIFDVAVDVGTVAGTVNITGAVLTIRPSLALTNSAEYAIRIASTAIKDAANNTYAGIADDTTLSFTTVAGTGPVFNTNSTYFVSTSNVPAGTTKITFKAKMYFGTYQMNQPYLFTQVSSGCDLRFTAQGNYWLVAEDSAGTNIMSFQSSIKPPQNTWATIEYWVDQTAGIAKVIVDGVDVLVRTPTAGGTFQTNRQVTFLGTSGGSGLMNNTQFEYFEVYYNDVLHKRIDASSGIANINSDFWKRGGDVT